MKHRALAALTAFSLLTVGLLPAGPAVQAAGSGTCGEHLTWTLEGDTLTIEGTGAMYDYHGSAPEGELAPWSTGGQVIGWNIQTPGNRDIRRIVVGEGVTSIGDAAFDGCGSLTQVSLPHSLHSIGQLAFSDCTGLTGFTVPDSVTSIGAGAFRGCTHLKQAVLPDSVTSIGNQLFGGCTELEEVRFPARITAFTDFDYVIYGDDAPVGFLGDCYSLTRVELPVGMTRTPECCFWESTVGEVVLPAGMLDATNEPFLYCVVDTVTVLDPGCRLEGTYSHAFGFAGDDIQWEGTLRGYAGSTAQAYAEKYDLHFEALAESERALGDPDGSGRINANDAAMVLRAAARVGAKRHCGLTGAQQTAADVDRNTRINANDAALILRYAAYVGAKGTKTLDEFLGR